MKTLLLSALLLSGCGQHIYACKSTCGMYVEYPVEQDWCDELQETEDRALTAFYKVEGDNRFKDSCNRLQGTLISVQTTRYFVDSWGRSVSGLAACYSGIVYLGSQSPSAGALAHEMAHVIQNCAAVGPLDKEDPDHSHWEDSIGPELIKVGLSW